MKPDATEPKLIQSKDELIRATARLQGHLPPHAIDIHDEPYGTMLRVLRVISAEAHALKIDHIAHMADFAIAQAIEKRGERA